MHAVSMSHLGMIGLGVMGRNLLFNMAEHDFCVAGYDSDPTKITQLIAEAPNHHVQGFTTLPAFVAALKTPRVIMLLVPAGEAVDTVIQSLIPYLSNDDCLIDGGNSYYKDSLRRETALIPHGIHFLSVGISGGESGARHGPSIMPSGPLTAYQRVKPIFDAIAANVDHEPCVTYLGTGATGHVVKMVHNGIEYGLMQLIAESYAFLKQGLKYSNAQLATVYQQWNQGELASFLMEITALIVNVKDPLTTDYLLEHILAVARQKGTGLWTSLSAMEWQVPIPTIDSAVTLRDMSVLTEQRKIAAKLYHHASPTLSDKVIDALADALYVAMLLCYGQGFALLKEYQRDLDLAAVAKLWRGGCIIRAKVLDDIVNAYRHDPHVKNILLATTIAERILPRLPQLRTIVSQAVLAGIAIPSLMASIGYLDAYCSESPANMIAAQRDYFGAHGYERSDQPGHFHTDWLTPHD